MEAIGLIACAVQISALTFNYTEIVVQYLQTIRNQISILQGLVHPPSPRRIDRWAQRFRAAVALTSRRKTVERSFLTFQAQCQTLYFRVASQGHDRTITGHKRESPTEESVSKTINPSAVDTKKDVTPSPRTSRASRALANRAREPSGTTQGRKIMRSSAGDKSLVVNPVAAPVDDLLQDHAFDGDLRASRVYSKAPLHLEDAEANDSRNQISMGEPFHTRSSLRIMGQFHGQEEYTATHAGYGDAEVLTITASFGASVESFSKDRHANKVKKDVILTDDFGECQLGSALLDTGADGDSISEAKLSALRLKHATRKLRPPEEICAASGSITVFHVAKVKWRLVNETASYKHKFWVVQGLEHEIIIGRDSIFKHGLLVNNLELNPSSHSNENGRRPELLVMGMERLSKAAKKDQDERTAAKEKENQTQRDKEANEIRERLAAQASSSTVPANAGGSASSS